jgi:biopolymer transport protein ExbD
MRFQRTARDLPSINLTPLIDILFLVLMFLVLTATFRGTFALDLMLPAAETAAPASVEAPNIVRVVVTADGQVLMEDRPVSLEEFERRLTALPGRDRLSIILSADARSRHGDVVAVMDRVRRASIFNVRLEATPPRDGGR